MNTSFKKFNILIILVLVTSSIVILNTRIAGLFGLSKPSLSGYFKALETQNPAYDYNSDGIVDINDYVPMAESISQTGSDAAEADAIIETTPQGTAAAPNIPLPSLTGFSTDPYSGSVTADYGFDLPPGPAGLTPPLGLAYSSSSVDDMYTGTKTKWRNDPDHPYQQQAGIFGLGWSLNGLSSISRDTFGTLNHDGDDGFILTFPGGSARLVKESETLVPGSYGTGTSVWRTSPNLRAKIERYAICKPFNTLDDINVCRYKWIVYTPDGTKYVFGQNATTDWYNKEYDPDKRYYSGTTAAGEWFPLYNTANPDGTLNGYTPWQVYTPDYYPHALVYQWPLTSVESVYGSSAKIDYLYAFQIGLYKYYGSYYTMAIYPAGIYYGRNLVEFVRQNRLDRQVHHESGTLNDSPQPFYASQRISEIRISTKPALSTSYKLRNKYEIFYKYGWDKTKHYDDGDGIPESATEVKGGQVIHSLLEKITSWAE